MVAGRAEALGQRARADQGAVRIAGRTVLLPHQEEGAPRPPLPAQHGVAAEGADVEVARQSYGRFAPGEEMASLAAGRGIVRLAAHHRRVEEVELEAARRRQLA